MRGKVSVDGPQGQGHRITPACAGKRANCSRLILPVKNDDEELNAYAHDLYGYLLDNNIRADIDERAEKLGYRVREAQVKKIPYLIILGKQEAQDGTVSYRLHGQQNTTTVSRDEFLAMLKDEIATKKLSK